MVGKRRLNRRLRRGSPWVMFSRSAGRDDSPFRGSAGRLGVEDVKLEALNHGTLNQETLNQERSAVNSIGRRSDCQSRKIPPTRNTKSASQTPAAGERRPCFAKDTPIKEIE